MPIKNKGISTISLTIKVYSKHIDYIREKGGVNNKVHVHYIDSLFSQVREYQAIKSSEFCPMINKILDPSLVNNSASRELS